MSGDGWNSMDGQPRFCAVCNKRILLNGEPVVFHTSDPKRSYHARCKRTLNEQRMIKEQCEWGRAYIAEQYGEHGS